VSLEKTLHPDEKVKAGKIGGQLTKIGATIAVVFLVISLILGSMLNSGADADHHWKRFLYAYVIGWSFIFAVCVGALWLVLLHHLCRGRWATAVRRIAEAISGAFPVVFVAGLGFIIPLLAGYKNLYYWAHPDAHNPEINQTMLHKLGWLEPGFFTVRFVIYGVIYSVIAAYFAKKSRQQDESGDPKLSDTMRIASGPAMVAYSLITCLAAFDILMSLAPKWYSTIYGVNFWGGACVAGFAVLGLVVLGVQRTGRLTHSVNANHYHDIGKWMFAFTFFWAYTQFSQFMLQWYGNMPEETVWYKYRLFGDWQWVSIAILVGFWAFPFLFLMSRWTKRIVPALVFFCVWQLVFFWLQLYWNVMPQYDWSTVYSGAASINAGPLSGNISYHHVGFTPVDVTVWLGLVGVLIAGIGRNLTGNLIPVKDPTLGLSLAHDVM
jgi:heme/copper-type cytochrome/quinol oxidase subunit 2